MGDILNDIADLSSWIWSSATSLPPWIYFLVAIAIGAPIYGAIKNPMRSIGALILILGAWVLAMPTGVQAVQKIWEYETWDARSQCTSQLVRSIDYWNYEKSPETACSSIHDPVEKDTEDTSPAPVRDPGISR